MLFKKQKEWKRDDCIVKCCIRIETPRISYYVCRDLEEITRIISNINLCSNE